MESVDIARDQLPDLEYMEWYTDLLGGRKPLTVGQLKGMLAGLPDEMEVKVSHQFDRHPVGIHDPIIRDNTMAEVVDVVRGVPAYGVPAGKQKVLIVE